MNILKDLLPSKALHYTDYQKKGRFANNVSKMLIGNILAQAIGFFASLIIARLYTPTDFGATTLVLSITSILSIFASMRYEQAIVLPNEPRKAFDIVMLSISLVVIFSLFFLPLALVVARPMISQTKLYGREYLLWFTIPGVLVFGLLQIITYWHTSLKRFSVLSFNQLLIQAASAVSKIGAGIYIGSSAAWLIAGNIIGQAVAVLLLGITFIKYDFKKITGWLSIDRLKTAAREFSDFPKYRSWNGFINELSQTLPVFFLAYLFSNTIVGYYGLANVALRKPVELVSSSLTNVFYQKIAEMDRKGQSLRKHLTKVTLGLIGVGVVPFAILTVFGRWIFTLLFGKEWDEAGLYAQLLAPWLFMLFINPPCTQIILVKRRLRFNLYFDVVGIFVKAGAIIIGSRVCTQPWFTVFLFSGTGILANLYYMRYAFSLVSSNNDS